MTTIRKAYDGTQQKLVLSFDVGTTFSGISYSILEPGQVPVIKGVTRFPAQDGTNGASKIPTIMYYDKLGNVCAAGAEATRDETEIEAEENGWVRAEWFKLHLCSAQMILERDNSVVNEAGIHSLPPGKRAVDVLADFLRYLYDCAAQYIKDSHLNGPILWDSVFKNGILYVLSHPNGWGGKEQEKMREAAFLAGLIPDKNSLSLSFVTEGEASLHFCISAGILSQADMERDPGIIIVDAGGGTIDVSAYKRNMEDKRMVFEEVAPAQCLFQGAVYVNIYAKRFLVGLLQDSPFIDDVDHMVKAFEKSSKIRFKTDKNPQYVKFGGTRDNDASCNVRFGQLKLDGSDVATFFKPSVDAIVSAVLYQQRSAAHRISHVLLVGGFSANDWLFNNVSKTLAKEAPSLQTFRPEAQTAKAVADGSMSFYLDHFVRVRMSKFCYGIEVSHQYNPMDPEHRSRAHKTHTLADGQHYLYEGFDVILPRSTQVAEEKLFRKNGYTKTDLIKSNPEQISCAITYYKGFDSNPRWIDIERKNYDIMCIVRADLTSLPISSVLNLKGQTYYKISFDILLFFGLTEIKAQIAWTTKEGQEMRGPASVLYEPDD